MIKIKWIKETHKEHKQFLRVEYENFMFVLRKREDYLLYTLKNKVKVNHKKHKNNSDLR